MTGGEHSHGNGENGPLPATQFDCVEDGQVVRVAAEQANRYARLGTIVEVVLVAIAAGALVTLAGVQLNTSRTNKVGVDRIVGCTTQGYDCYEEQQRRNTQLVGELLARLAEGHQVIECFLGVQPPERDNPAVLARCRAEAAEATRAALEQVAEKARLAEEAARKVARENGGD